LNTVAASRPGKSRSQYRPFQPLPHTLTPPENRGPYRPAVLQVEVTLFLPGFRKYSVNAVSSVGVDIVSCGTGKRDRRIGNPGLYRACLGYGLPVIAKRGLFKRNVTKGDPDRGRGNGLC